MGQDFPLFPEQASTLAPRVDALYFFLLSVTVIFSLLIFGLLVFFAVRYRRRSEGEKARHVKQSLLLELTWIAIPLGLCGVMFFWGAKLFFEEQRSPAEALDVYVVARQWMWKLQHAEGASEINELHVPLGRAVRLTMTSQDVIHSFYVPAFRIKQDVLPGRYTATWFVATRPGSYRLFCAEYCGTKHSGMTGRVIVMEPARYQEWLSERRSGPGLAAVGGRLFQSLGCATCHNSSSQAKGPNLEDLLGRTVILRDGRTVVADEAYIRESILDPAARVVAGYEPLMPSYRAQLGEEELLQLLAYLKSLKTERELRELK